MKAAPKAKGGIHQWTCDGPQEENPVHTAGQKSTEAIAKRGADGLPQLGAKCTPLRTCWRFRTFMPEFLNNFMADCIYSYLIQENFIKKSVSNQNNSQISIITFLCSILFWDIKRFFPIQMCPIMLLFSQNLEQNPIEYRMI